MTLPTRALGCSGLETTLLGSGSWAMGGGNTSSACRSGLLRWVRDRGVIRMRLLISLAPAVSLLRLRSDKAGRILYRKPEYPGETPLLSRTSSRE
jgi:hypothetical protein